MTMCAFGTKRTCANALQMSAFDPKRTFRHIGPRSTIYSRAAPYFQLQSLMPLPHNDVAAK